MKKKSSGAVVRMLVSTMLLVAGVISVIFSSGNLMAATSVCTPAPSGMVGWWQAEGNALDSVSNNNGVVSPGLTFTNGKVSQSFLLNNAGAYFHMPASPALNVGLGSGFTIETWIKPSNVNGLHPIVEWNNSVGGIGVQFWIGENPWSQGVLCAYVMETNGNNYIHVASPNGALVADTWQHVAATYDRSSHVIKVYINGAAVSQTVWAGNVPQTGYDLWVGRRPADTSGSWTDGTFLGGPLDELSLYNRALTTNEIAAIYAARSSGKCPLPPTVLSVTPTNWYVNEGATVTCTAMAVGSPTLAYQWQHNSLDLPGAISATLTLSNVVYAQAGNYAVVISNPGGMTTSSNVLLRVNRVPVADASAIEGTVISPNGINAIVVLDGSRSSDPDGDALTYAWFISGNSSILARGVVAVTNLPVGTNLLLLVVNDGMAPGTHAFAIEVITTSQAVDRLIELVRTGSGHIQPLIASLRAALAAIDRGQPAVAINQLEAFIHKVHVQLEPLDSVLAAQLIAEAQAIIDALKGGSAVMPSVSIMSISHDQNRKPHLKIRGYNGRVLVVETSTNMVDWVPVGVAAQSGDGTYEFDDAPMQDTGARFYRVVSPK